MATLTQTTYPTLLDFARRSDPNGKIETIVEMLTDTNDVLKDMSWVEGNLPTGHRTTIRSGLPTATWRKLNYGVQPSLSQTVQVTDSCGMLEAYGEVDKALAELNGNKASWRLSEERSFLESMNQAMATAIFYGDTATDPEKFMGLTPRYDTVCATDTAAGFNLINGAGTNADKQTSIWLVVWGDTTCHGIIPKGSKAGFQHTDLGEVTAENWGGTGLRGQIYRTHYRWDCGLTLRDWRYVVRICNIDSTKLTTDSSGPDIVKLMLQAIHKVPNLSGGRPVWYCNRDVLTWLDIQSLGRAASVTSYGALKVDYPAQGQPVAFFRGIPVRRCDALVNTEALVTGF